MSAAPTLWLFEIDAELDCLLEAIEEQASSEGQPMVLYYLLTRNLQKIEGQQFTQRARKNSQDSVKITDQAMVPTCSCKIEARVTGEIWETVLSLLAVTASKIFCPKICPKKI